MTDDRWGELERLAREATPGPWRSGENMATDNRWVGGGDDEVICLLDEANSPVRQQRANAAYIAAAHPQAILDLVGALRTAEQRRAGEDASTMSKEMALRADYQAERAKALALRSEVTRAEARRLEAEAERDALHAEAAEAQRVAETAIETSARVILERDALRTQLADATGDLVLARATGARTSTPIEVAAERDALRAEVERLRGAVKVRARCCDLVDYGHRDGCPGAS